MAQVVSQMAKAIKGIVGKSGVLIVFALTNDNSHIRIMRHAAIT